MSKSEYKDIQQAAPSEWSLWEIWPRKVRLRCCSCALTHDIEIKVDKNGKTWFRLRINHAATHASRRHQK